MMEAPLRDADEQNAVARWLTVFLETGFRVKNARKACTRGGLPVLLEGVVWSSSWSNVPVIS